MVVVVVVAITRTLPVGTCTLLFFSPSVVNAVWVIVVLPHTLTHTGALSLLLLTFNAVAICLAVGHEEGEGGR